MSRNLDTSLLRAFVAVAETAGMTSAANVLHLTQAAVSQQIKRLEDRLGCTVLERDGRTSKLTEDGERLLDYAATRKRLATNFARRLRPANLFTRPCSTTGLMKG